MAGVSYDFVKCFVLIPHGVMFRVLRERGMDEGVARALAGMYKAARCRFRLGKALGTEFPIYGGLVQGCALSMMCLNALVAVVMEKIPGGGVRSYADDLSSTCRARTRTAPSDRC